jgi:hypothetical protein
MRRPNAPPDALPALRRAPLVGHLKVAVGNQINDRSDDNIYKV